jgi:sirohydrochlorin cobaltochelatase
VVAYNEFCAPSLDDAVTELVADGVGRITVVPSMLDARRRPLGVEIPETLVALRSRFPGVELRYAWPFDADAVADLLALQLRGRHE